MTRLTGTDAFGLMEAYNAVYIPQELTEEQIQEDFETWVSSLMEEGNDLSDYTWDEMFDIYIDEAKEDENLTPLQKIRKRNKRDSESLVSKPGGQTDERRAYHKAGRGEKKKKGETSAFGTMRHVGGPYKEEVDLYDVILSHLLDEGYAESVEQAEVIMVNMSEDWRDGILDEAAKDQSDKQIEKGVKTTYKAQNVLDNLHQGRSRGVERTHYSDRDAKVKRMRGRLKSRRDDLFGERNKREDESRAELKKKYGF